jgi:hypothetical protein
MVISAALSLNRPYAEENHEWVRRKKANLQAGKKTPERSNPAPIPVHLILSCHDFAKSSSIPRLSVSIFLPPIFLPALLSYD